MASRSSYRYQRIAQGVAVYTGFSSITIEPLAAICALEYGQCRAVRRASATSSLTASSCWRDRYVCTHERTESSHLSPKGQTRFPKPAQGRRSSRSGRAPVPVVPFGVLRAVSGMKETTRRRLTICSGLESRRTPARSRAAGSSVKSSISRISPRWPFIVRWR
jgi:hypothetical protein